MPRVYENVHRCYGCDFFQAVSCWCMRFKCKELDPKPEEPERPRRQRGARRLSEEQEAERMALYEQGLNDVEIGAQCHPPRSATSIAGWRMSHGLESNAFKGRHRTKACSPEEHARRRDAYHKTNGDAEAARLLGIPACTFSEWRRSRGLPSAFRSKARRGEQ